MLKDLLGRRLRLAVMCGFVAGAVTVPGVAPASVTDTPPGVQRSTPRAQLTVGSDVTRGQLLLGFARSRLAEAAGMHGDDQRLPGTLDDMDAHTRQGVRLLTTSAVAHRQTTVLNTVDTFVVRQRAVLTLGSEQFETLDRERVQSSLDLLDAVTERSLTIREGLACDHSALWGFDVLGPRLKGCVATGSTDRAGSDSTSDSDGLLGGLPGSLESAPVARSRHGA